MKGSRRGSARNSAISSNTNCGVNDHIELRDTPRFDPAALPSSNWHTDSTTADWPQPRKALQLPKKNCSFNTRSKIIFPICKSETFTDKLCNAGTGADARPDAVNRIPAPLILEQEVQSEIFNTLLYKLINPKNKLESEIIHLLSVTILVDLR